MKGKTSCNVTACQQPFIRFWERNISPWWNTSTRAWYCPYCAVKINRACLSFKENVVCFESGSREFTELPSQDKP